MKIEIKVDVKNVEEADVNVEFTTECTPEELKDMLASADKVNAKMLEYIPAFIKILRDN